MTALEVADARSTVVDTTVLAFDFGLRRLGVAVGMPALRQAHPLTTVETADNAARFAAIERLIAQWRPERLVVGLPRHEDGREHELAARCRRFARQLHGRFGLPVELADEFLSSADAESRLRAAGVDARRHKSRIDALAAQVILETYFDAASGR